MPLFVLFSSPARAIDHQDKSEASEEKQEEMVETCRQSHARSWTRAGMLGSGPLCSFASIRSLVSGHRLLLSPLEQAHSLGQQLQKDLSQESMALRRKVSMPAWCKHRAHVFGVKKTALGVRTDLATTHSH